MPGRYSVLLQAAYGNYQHTLVAWPAGGKNANYILTHAQLEKLDGILKSDTPSLDSTLADFGVAVSNAYAGKYNDQKNFEQDSNKLTRLLTIQIESVQAIFASFSRDYDAWVKAGATLDWSARKKATDKQQDQDKKLQSIIGGIQCDIDTDLADLKARWPSSSPDEPVKPDNSPEASLDLSAQREAILNASLNGVPLVAVDQSLIGDKSE